MRCGELLSGDEFAETFLSEQVGKHARGPERRAARHLFQSGSDGCVGVGGVEWGLAFAYRVARGGMHAWALYSAQLLNARDPAPRVKISIPVERRTPLECV